jgi:serine/threonine protein phosphatase PrpC
MSDSRNIRLTLAYDGTNYCGWQVQSNGPSIQAALERAIERLTGVKSAVYSAGRTDSGVHALAQVANFHTTFPMPAENFRPALQTKLPHDIVILCTDGLTKMLEEQDILDYVLAFQGSPDQIGRQLIDAANARGGKDNTTVIVIAPSKADGSAP